MATFFFYRTGKSPWATHSKGPLSELMDALHINKYFLGKYYYNFLELHVSVIHVVAFVWQKRLHKWVRPTREVSSATPLWLSPPVKLMRKLPIYWLTHRNLTLFAGNCRPISPETHHHGRLLGFKGSLGQAPHCCPSCSLQLWYYFDYFFPFSCALLSGFAMLLFLENVFGFFLGFLFWVLIVNWNWQINLGDSTAGFIHTSVFRKCFWYFCSFSLKGNLEISLPWVWGFWLIIIIIKIYRYSFGGWCGCFARITNWF